MAGDRISEAYYGEMGESLKETTHLRLNFLLSKLHGEKVLDVGCSQGIFPILAARAGKNVVGIDNDAGAIEYASAALLNEQADTRDRTRFLCADFLVYDFGKERYDTIVFGEIIEHLEEPEKFLKKAAVLLKNDGVIIASVPFGINRHPDHKKTYYFYGLYSLLNEYFQVIEVSYMGKWIAMIGGRKGASDNTRYELNSKAFSELEDSVYKIEELWEEKDKYNIQKIHSITENYETVKGWLDNKNKQLEASNKRTEGINNELTNYKKKCEEQSSAIKKLSDEAQIDKKRIEDLEALLRKSAQEFKKEEQYLIAIQNKNMALNKQLRNAEEEVQRLERKVNIIKGNVIGRAGIKVYHFLKRAKNKIIKK